MNKKNLELLGLKDGATAEEIDKAYEELRAKYLEDRFLDGEAGNNAAKMLTKIEVAHQELLTELNENVSASDGGASYEKVEELLKAGNVEEAQRVLDAFNERTAQWHYLQSVIFYRKHCAGINKGDLVAVAVQPNVSVHANVSVLVSLRRFLNELYACKRLVVLDKRFPFAGKLTRHAYVAVVVGAVNLVGGELFGGNGGSVLDVYKADIEWLIVERGNGNFMYARLHAVLIIDLFVEKRFVAKVDFALEGTVYRDGRRSV